ncbi:MAG TPA: carboxypeptidase-like regulatory domain-containing protein, partial [Pyrinomonadaceae bacterium]|nr:carboxypeptidase-like regulatory domain-containing protein [Pyrinomonadaceae bacterium]
MIKSLSIILALGVWINVFAQGSGEIKGTVTDENGAKIAGAQVVLNSSAGVHLNTSTDKAGNFEY